ncbi:hypothetical protein HUJ04_004246 [Dendroctonus ponderosae]|nr:hypothetical protein HUJ04_004246 [Dendroctonus ponderosae]
MSHQQLYAFIVLALFVAISAAFPADLEKASDVNVQRGLVEGFPTPNQAPKANAEIVALVRRSVDNDLDTAASMIFRPLFVYRKFSAKKRRVNRRF